MKQGKIWGETRPLLVTPSCEVHEVRIRVGGRCSQHRHLRKVNAFYVVSGRLSVSIDQDDYDLIDETILGPGDFTIVRPGLFHWFQALEDTVALEVYYLEPEPLSADIDRRDVGDVPG